MNRKTTTHTFPLNRNSVLSEPVIFRDDRGEFLRLVSLINETRTLMKSAGTSASARTVQSANGEVTVYDAGDTVADREVSRITLRFAMPGPSVLTGLGQHEDGVFDYTGQREYLYHNNMIISVPFLLSSAGWGLWIDAGCAMRFSAEEKAFTLCLEAVESATVTVIRDENPAEVLRCFVGLTGKPALLPKWAFGYIQSRERYQSAAELTETVSEFRKRGIGLDCIVQDWLTWSDGLWGDKHPDPTRFPSVRTLTDTLRRDGVHLMISVWPNMNKGADHDAFKARNLFLPDSDVYNAFLPEARDLYWAQTRAGWLDDGTDAIWCDSAEPFTDADWHGEIKRSDEERYHSVTEDSARHLDETLTLEYARAHCGGIAERWRRDFPERRVVNLCRNGYAGAARDGVIVWSGDISATWETYRRQITEGIKASSSGLAYWTVDIGGFFVNDGRVGANGCGCGGRPNPQWFWRGDYQDGAADPGYRELYVRWLQWGSMLPVFRSHGTDTPREPWHFGNPGEPVYDAILSAIALRYRLLPYFYATAEAASRDGLPMLRALLTAFPGDLRVERQDRSFMMGDSLLVAPVTQPARDGKARTEVYLPEGCLWYSWFTGEAFPGGQSIQVDSDLSTFPLFVRSGGILPLSRPVNCTAELSPLADELMIFAGNDGSFVLYDDAGDGDEYLRGEYIRVHALWNDKEQCLTLDDKEGVMTVDRPLTVTLRRRDGSVLTRELRYTGARTELRFS